LATVIQAGNGEVHGIALMVLFRIQRLDSRILYVLAHRERDGPDSPWLLCTDLPLPAKELACQESDALPGEIAQQWFARDFNRLPAGFEFSGAMREVEWISGERLRTEQIRLIHHFHFKRTGMVRGESQSWERGRKLLSRGASILSSPSTQSMPERLLLRGADVDTLYVWLTEEERSTVSRRKVGSWLRAFKAEFAEEGRGGAHGESHDASQVPNASLAMDTHFLSPGYDKMLRATTLEASGKGSPRDSCFSDKDGLDRAIQEVMELGTGCSVEQDCQDCCPEVTGYI